MDYLVKQGITGLKNQINHWKWDLFCDILLTICVGSRLARSHDQLYAHHVLAWSEAWKQGRVDVVGNSQLSQTIYGSLYYLLSSIPLHKDKKQPFVGLSPAGLPFGDSPLVRFQMFLFLFISKDLQMATYLLVPYGSIVRFSLSTFCKLSIGVDWVAVLCLRYATLPLTSEEQRQHNVAKKDSYAIYLSG